MSRERSCHASKKARWGDGESAHQAPTILSSGVVAERMAKTCAEPAYFAIAGEKSVWLKKINAPVTTILPPTWLVAVPSLYTGSALKCFHDPWVVSRPGRQ